MDEDVAQSTTLDFLVAMYGEEPRGLLWVGGQSDGWRGATFRTPAEAAGYARYLDQQGGIGVYHRLTTLAGTPRARGTDEDTGWVYALGFDLDIDGPGHKPSSSGLPHPPNEEMLWALLGKAELPAPTFWTASGGGFYPMWRLDEPLDARSPDGRALAASLLKDTHLRLKSAFTDAGYALDGTFDLSRVYRLPGTWNRKPEMLTPALAEVRDQSNRRFSATLFGARPAVPPSSSQLFMNAGEQPPSPWPYSQAVAEFDKQAEIIKNARTNINTTVGGAARYAARVGASLLGFDRTVDALLACLNEGGYHSDEWNAANGKDWTGRSLIEAAVRRGMAEAVQVLPAAGGTSASAASETASRRVDLRKYLDGTYAPPQPVVGLERSDGKLLLYPGRWHTVIGPNGTGKSFLALAHCIAEMRKGNAVVYAHFEEPEPGGTLYRLRAMAPDLTVEVIEALFVWLDCASSWTLAEWARDISAAQPTLTVLDGINDASTRQGWDPSDIMAPGNYADLFVTPARVCGSAVFSLGHPPKAKGRETERHGFGSTAWLDKLEGVGFRLLPSKKPIRDEHHGYAMLYTVKDRYGQVQKGLEPATEKDMDGWYVVGSFWVDSETPGRSTYGIKQPELNEDGSRVSTIDVLANRIVDVLKNDIERRWAFSSLRRLGEMLREGGVKYSEPDLAPAVDTLVRRGVLDSPVPERPRQSRSGAVSLLTTASWEGLGD